MYIHIQQYFLDLLEWKLLQRFLQFDLEHSGNGFMMFAGSRHSQTNLSACHSCATQMP